MFHNINFFLIFQNSYFQKISFFFQLSAAVQINGKCYIKNKNISRKSCCVEACIISKAVVLKKSDSETFPKTPTKIVVVGPSFSKAACLLFECVKMPMAAHQV